MQVREDPKRAGIYFVATFRGDVLRVERLEVGFKVRTVLSLASAKIGWMYSIALHPQFESGKPNTNRMFVFYRSHDEAKRKFYRVSAFPITDEYPAEAMDEEVLIEQEIGHYEHLGGAIEFDNDGFLLIAVGDNGLYNDLSENSQKIDKSLLSGVLRIDVDCKVGSVSRRPRTYPVGAKTKGYFIPLDNPFLNVPGAHGEFWSIGYRNPFRMSVDKQTGKAWIGEVGQDRIEQIEVATAGSNHLWSFREGTETFDKSYLRGRSPAKVYGTLTQPFHEYRHENQNYCVVGGMVYRGDRFPELTGYYMFGDNQSSRVWAIHPDDPTDKRLVLQLPIGKKHASLTSISTDAAGRIFLRRSRREVLAYRFTS